MENSLQRKRRIPLQKSRDLKKSRLKKKCLRKPRLLSAPSHARPTISFVNCYKMTQKHNGIESCPKCTQKSMGGFDRYKQNHIHTKAYASLIECIEFHKRTFFSVDTAERLKYYLLCSVKKPMKSTVRMHVTRMETLNKYIGMLPTI